MAICFLEKGSFPFFFFFNFFFWGGGGGGGGAGRGLGRFEFFEYIAELNNACMRTPMTRHDGDKHSTQGLDCVCIP